MSTFTIVNNEFLTAEEASLLVTDLAIQRGYGIFDFFKTVDGEPVFFEDHMDRFFNSASEMRLPIELSRSDLKALLDQLNRKNGFSDSGIRITLTGGYSADAYELSKPNMVITQLPLTLSKEINMEGIKLITHEHQRQLSHVKTIDYLMAIWLKPLVEKHGADDVLYHNNGMVRECPRANFCIITRDNKLLTAKDSILHGVIRKHLLQICESHQAGGAGDITLEDVKNCKEAFITSSTKNILPVTQIDGRIIGDGKAGEMTQWLYKELRKLY